MLGAIICKWPIEKVILLPFGGITIFQKPINHSLNEELLIAVLGPLFQILFFLFFKNGNPLFTTYNKIILYFNLLPIVPLDGSKIISVICNKLFPFQMSNYLTLIFSSIVFFIFLLYSICNHHLVLFLILFFIGKKILEEIINQKYYFHKFLLERYLYIFPFKKEKIIKKIRNMQQEKRHLLQNKGKYIEEKEFLRKMFDKLE